MLGGLPPDAIPFGSRGQQTQLLALMGKYVDRDGIVYEVDGAVNESATAAWAREVAAGRTAAPYVDYEAQAAQQRADSVQQNSEADAARASFDAFVDNIFFTGENVVGRAIALPGQVADAAKKAATEGFKILPWVVAGIIAYAVIKVADRMPSQGHVKKYVRKRISSTRRALARQIAGD